MSQKLQNQVARYLTLCGLAHVHSVFVTLAVSVHTFIFPETALHELLKAVLVEVEPLVSVSP